MDAKLFFFIIAATLQLAIPFLQSWGKVKDEQTQKLTSLGKWLLGLSLLSFGIMLGLFVITDDQEERYKQKVKDVAAEHHVELLNAQQRASDKQDSSKNALIEVLAKYGLKYDSAQQRIEKLVKDSANRKVEIHNLPDPIFSLCDVTETRDRDTLRITAWYCSSIAPSYNIDVYLTLISEFKGGKLEKNEPHRMFPSGVVIPPGRALTDEITFLNPPNNLDFTYFLLSGYYETSQGKKIKIDRILTYSHKKKSLGEPYPHVEKRIREFLKDVSK